MVNERFERGLMMNSVAIVAFGAAAAWLIFWILEARAASQISAHARAQLGLRPDLLDQSRPKPTLSKSSQRRLLVGLTISAPAILIIGPAGVIVGVIPTLVARAVHKRSVQKRQRALDDALAPALQRIVDQLSVGRTMSSAIEASIEHASAPLDGIFRRVISDYNVGISIDESLSAIATEESNRHLDIIASALGLHAQHGGSLSDILIAVLESIEEEDRLRRDLLTLTADARLSANVLLAMPVGALVITSLLSPGYATPLIATSAGRIMSIGGVVLGSLGVFWLRRLAQPETA